MFPGLKVSHVKNYLIKVTGTKKALGVLLSVLVTTPNANRQYQIGNINESLTRVNRFICKIEI